MGEFYNYRGPGPGGVSDGYWGGGKHGLRFPPPCTFSLAFLLKCMMLVVGGVGM